MVFSSRKRQPQGSKRDDKVHVSHSPLITRYRQDHSYGHSGSMEMGSVSGSKLFLVVRPVESIGYLSFVKV